MPDIRAYGHGQYRTLILPMNKVVGDATSYRTDILRLAGHRNVIHDEVIPNSDDMGVPAGARTELVGTISFFPGTPERCWMKDGIAGMLLPREEIRACSQSDLLHSFAIPAVEEIEQPIPAIGIGSIPARVRFPGRWGLLGKDIRLPSPVPQVLARCMPDDAVKCTVEPDVEQMPYAVVLDEAVIVHAHSGRIDALEIGAYGSGHRKAFRVYFRQLSVRRPSWASAKMFPRQVGFMVSAIVEPDGPAACWELECETIADQILA